ncbi:AAA family ATPase [Ancylobacter rudongensis]|uniref:UvrD/REP helicase N-terminal domain-containing protein n=1 Tax=Ancylobacter rudongensis TaxID=177413 RepID=A0A1G4PPN3_9HYPH|nr:AAA family ATPase [Ancylobacter rudongensis]SCW34212.1 UvrD/REP helicase N-terminal domain-containing protein [Ancylobacter rudongensis]
MSLLWRRRRDLHQDQINAIEGLPSSGKYLLLGPPGSGKTSILLHRGQFLRLPPHQLANVILVTFSRTLREFISLSGDDRFPSELIHTQRSLVDMLFQSYGEHPPTVDGDLLEQNRARAEAANELLALRGRKIMYDAVLIDEIQDLCEAELKLLTSISDRVMLVGDIRQQVYRSSDVMAAAAGLCDRTIELRHHFRISQDICLVADRIIRNSDFSLAEYAHYVGPTPTRPSVIGPLSPEAQVSAVAEALDLQLDTYNDPSDLLGVVVGRTEECDDILERFRAIPKLRNRCGVFHSGVVNRQFGQDCRICITTVQSCKGLEFRALHWPFADATPYLTRQKAYTVVTRAKSSLTLYRHGALPAILSGAIPPTPQRLFEDDD